MEDLESITFLKSSDMVGVTQEEISLLQKEISNQWQSSRYRNSRDVWWADGIPLKDSDTYDATFKPLINTLGYKSIEDILVCRRELGLCNHVVDIMGGAYFLEHPELADSLTGFRKANIDMELEEKYAEETFPGDTRHLRLEHLLDMLDSEKRNIFTGDVFNLDDWENLKNMALKSYGIKGFDLVFLRPEGPFLRTLSGLGKDSKLVKFEPYLNNLYRGLYFNLFSNAVSTMASENSILFAQFPRIMSNDLELFSARVNQYPGFSCITHSGVRKTSSDNQIPNFIICISRK